MRASVPRPGANKGCLHCAADRFAGIEDILDEIADVLLVDERREDEALQAWDVRRARLRAVTPPS